jgi:hypothetical protein
MDFAEEDLIDAIERIVAGLLERAGASDPPVDALHIAEEHLGIPVAVVDPDEDESPRPRRRAGIVLSAGMTDEQKQRAAAEGIAAALIPEIAQRLGIDQERADRRFASHVRGLCGSRVLIPTRMLRTRLRDCKFDVAALQQVFATASMEMVALRLLDLDEPCVIAIVDDCVVQVRRGNRFAATKQLEKAEQQCLDRVMELDLPHRVRLEGWTVQGWPVPNRAFRRVILRAVRDDEGL